MEKNKKVYKNTKKINEKETSEISTSIKRRGRPKKENTEEIKKTDPVKKSGPIKKTEPVKKPGRPKKKLEEISEDPENNTDNEEKNKDESERDEKESEEEDQEKYIDYNNRRNVEEEPQYYIVENDEDENYDYEARRKKAEESKAARILIYKYHRGEIAEYISNLIRNSYKKDDPQQQSFWSTSITEICFIIKKNIWVEDKEGKMLCQLVVNPLLEEVYDIVSDFEPIRLNLTDESTYETSIGRRLLEDIKNGTIRKEILKIVSRIFLMPPINYMEAMRIKAEREREEALEELQAQKAKLYKQKKGGGKK